MCLDLACVFVCVGTCLFLIVFALYTKFSNEYCKDSDEAGSSACVLPSSWLWNQDDNDYVCSETLYKSNPYSCEVGDWSGKYGELKYDSNSKSITFEGGIMGVLRLALFCCDSLINVLFSLRFVVMGCVPQLQKK